ncbi:hypothetical protein AMTRI_Chr09g36600 [Amborella trichopoda]
MAKRATNVLEIIHSDICGPMNVTTKDQKLIKGTIPVRIKERPEDQISKVRTGRDPFQDVVLDGVSGHGKVVKKMKKMPKKQGKKRSRPSATEKCRKATWMVQTLQGMITTVRIETLNEIGMGSDHNVSQRRQQRYLLHWGRSRHFQYGSGKCRERGTKGFRGVVG